MDYLNDINAVPVMLGNGGRELFFTALRIRRRMGLAPHIFSSKAPLPLRALARCHLIPEGNTDLCCRALYDFASGLDESAIPVLITLTRSPHFSREQLEIIESIYISANSDGIL